jgi:hypothetical protein
MSLAAMGRCLVETSKFECWSAVSVYGPREPESVEYCVTVKSVKGKAGESLCEYSVFLSWKGIRKKNPRESFNIDSRGFFRNIRGTEGTLSSENCDR